ncbi:MAG: LPS assembly lipoprotein LptE [Burkholderiales bacterium]|nr:LPS assembly lipoprotein LptE [Burkholderiales bacterium]
MKTLTALLCTLLIAGCGFQLRGAANLPFDTLHVQAPVGSQFAVQFRRVVAAGSGTRIVDNPKAAAATLVLVTELREKSILSLSAGGRVREFQLRYRMSYRLLDKNAVETIPTTEIALTRDFSFNDQDTLSKEAEEALLFRDMQSDAVQQLVRRLQVAKLSTQS